MQYQLVVNEKGERLWLPILAGAAIISAPFWLGNRPCCNQNQYNNNQYPSPYYQPTYYQPYPYPYPYPLPYPYPNSNL